MRYKGTSEFIAYVEALEAKVKRLEKAMKEIADMKYTDNNDILRAKNSARKALEGE